MERNVEMGNKALVDLGINKIAMPFENERHCYLKLQFFKTHCIQCSRNIRRLCTDYQMHSGSNDS